jgi:hypothetical protein
MSNTKIETADAVIKGVVLGALTYAGAKLELTPELIAVLVPVAAALVSMISTKIGPKNTALLLSVATTALKAAPVIKAEPKPVAKAVKKTAPKKK